MRNIFYFWLIAILVFLIVFGFIMCSSLSPWVAVNDGKCLIGLCSKFLGCLK